MKYTSKVYGRVEWPWWHDTLIVAVVLIVVAVVSRVF